MIEAVALLLTICALLGFVGWLIHQQAQERRFLINSVIAKHGNEARLLNEIPPPLPEPFRPPLGRDEGDAQWLAELRDYAEGFDGQTGA